MSFQHSLSRRRMGMTIASGTLGALMLGVGATPAVASSEMPPPPAAPGTPLPNSVFTPKLEERDVQLEQALETVFAAVERLPAEVHNAPLSDAHVQQLLLADIMATTASARVAGNLFFCVLAVARFVAENAGPAGRILHLIRNFGGVKRFAYIVKEFIRHRTLPPDLSAELADLVVKLSGADDIIGACA